MTGPELLASYLNDHLAGATGGLELFRRAARTQAGTPAGPELRRLSVEVAQDRDALRGLMASLGVDVRSYKVWLGWGAEKAGRLKLNGRLLSRSPLSDVIELEAMALGVAGKAAGFRLLRELADTDSRLDAAQLDGLLQRAAQQQESLDRLRLAAGREVFARS